VKRLIFFILAIQIITSGNFISEVVKFNDLVDHFLEHQSSNQPLGVFDFFRLHYFNSHHEGSDPIRHSKLPLHQVSTTFVITVASAFEHVNIIAPLFADSPEFNPFKKGLIPQCHLVSIFQPPRFA